MPRAGATATLIHDLRELFKVRVTGMVVVTGWAGFYLGSMQSGISSLQRGLLDTLFGIGLVSAGAGALNQALERNTDARMNRTADRPLASGRFSLAFGILAGLGALGLGAVWLLLHTNLLTVALALLTAFTYVAIYTPLKRVTTLATFIGAFPGAMGPLLGWTAARGRIEWPAVALFAILFVWQFPHFMAIAWLYRDDYARAGIRMLPVVQPDGWSTVVEALFYAVLMIPVSLAPWWLGMTGAAYAVLATALGLLYLAYTIRFAGILRTRLRSEAACWRAICSRSASSTCRCSSPRSCSAPSRSTKERMTTASTSASPLEHRAPPSPPSSPSAPRPRCFSSGSSTFIPPRCGSTRFAFLPALNAVLNGLTATALLIGYTFIRARTHRRAPRVHDHGVRLLHALSCRLHRPPRAARRRPLPASTRTSAPFICRCWPATSFWPSWRCPWCWSRSSSRSPAAFPQHRKDRPLDLSPLALRLRHRRHHLRDAAPGTEPGMTVHTEQAPCGQSRRQPATAPPAVTRRRLHGRHRAAVRYPAAHGTGRLTHTGASTNTGWFALIVALMCMPFGGLLLTLGLAKWLRNRRLQRPK